MSYGRGFQHPSGTEREMERTQQLKGDIIRYRKGQSKQPGGSRYSLIGLIVGGIVGGIGGWLIFDLLGALLGLPGGIFCGGIIGAAIDASIMKRRYSKNLGETEEEKPDLSGPFKKA